MTLVRIVAAGIACIPVLLTMSSPTMTQPSESEALQLEARIPLGAVAGRIDHMAVDLARGRLFVAELGNNSVGVVDLKARKVVHRIFDLKEPQGVAYVAATDMLYVANAGDGAVDLFGGSDYAKAGTIELGDDADNIRVDPATRRVFVGYGSGGLAVIDAASGQKVADIPLKAHPESFRLALGGTRAYVNLPNSHAISVIDVTSGTQIAAWPAPAAGNFAMALDEEAQKVVVAFRNPAKLVAFSMVDSGVVGSVDTCGDIDDVFVDAKRQRIYASCGDGFVDVVEKTPPYRRVSRIRTVPGARTSLFVPELDRLFVAVRATAGEPAAIWVFRPAQ
jgi:DNA-binding beta-propeller fold protein YncE